MDFELSGKQKEWLDRVQSFMTKHVRPAVPVYKQQDEEGPRWKVIPILEDLKAKGYYYWALVHVHTRETVSTEPYIVLSPANTPAPATNSTTSQPSMRTG